MYTLEDLDNSLRKFNFIIEKYKDTIIDLTKLLPIVKSYSGTALKGEAYYLTGRYREAIIDLTNLLDIEQNSKFALGYRQEAYYIT
ncbi:hypothetical protein C2G38_2189073 [Gigaspora rosea]|uniref:Uncharacterized protein n=1 Tax=Gigaspora rosea TaxID=44941 RepID=A0A397V615_9GLOM|nr:hypothetical protein C2G38_2189073 [Gigaspora rosea]